MKRLQDGGYQITGISVMDSSACWEPEAWYAGLPKCNFSEITEVLKQSKYQAVIVTGGMERHQLRSFCWGLESLPVELILQSSLTDVAGPRVTIHSVEGMTLTHVDLPKYSGWQYVLKRIFDIIFSAAALLCLSPLLATIALLIKREDGGSAFFKQERIGLNGEPFTIHKFRTMCLDAESQMNDLIAANGGKALLFKLEDDPRITKIGHILRKYSLDELPQFWSVLQGGMSVVGPRPQVAREVAEYTDRHYRRLLVRPGITGLWQVSGRSNLDPEASIRLDLHYVENWSLLSDLIIVIKTVFVVLRGTGAS
jgi:exopolysaccharide biosynthesis polyprenyl glycosylphosphotransferase